MTPEIMIEEAWWLGRDLAGFSDPLQVLAHQLQSDGRWRAVSRVILIGHGDSYCASRAAELAFRSLGGLPCEPMFAQYFLDYAVDWINATDDRYPMVVGVSASGATPRLIEAIEVARRRGALTLALTASLGSRLSQVAEHALELVLPAKQPSPGVRSFHALLAGLLGLSIIAGEARGHLAKHDVQDLRGEISSLALMMEAEVRSAIEASKALATDLAPAPIVTFAGGGSSYGLALYGAAKIIEAAALPAKGEELEEWWHVPRFMTPASLPLIIIAPPGRSMDRARGLARQARDLGRLVVGVTDDEELARLANRAVPVGITIRESLSPLLYHVFTSQIAAHLALQLGRIPFDQRLISVPRHV